MTKAMLACSSAASLRTSGPGQALVAALTKAAYQQLWERGHFCQQPHRDWFCHISIMALSRKELPWPQPLGNPVATWWEVTWEGFQSVSLSPANSGSFWAHRWAALGDASGLVQGRMGQFQTPAPNPSTKMAFRHGSSHKVRGSLHTICIILGWKVSE